MCLREMNESNRITELALALAVFVSSAVFGSTVFAQDTAAESRRAEQLEERLLQAELLEVSSGDLKTAVEIYRVIADDEGAPGALRARALVRLGRCQRKLGQLEQAKRTFQLVLASHGDERGAARQAKSFLDELVTGKAASPDFDWLAELERNPEIQARVFDLVMDLADADRASNARRQLLALGSIAYPVLEKMVTTSRDTLHRMEIAFVLLEQGRFEFIGTVLDPANAEYLSASFGRSPAQRTFYFSLNSFLESLKRLDESARAEFLTALDAIPAHPALDDLVLRAALYAGDERELETKLRACERGSGHLEYSLLEYLVKRSPNCAEFAAARILEENVPLRLRDGYYKFVREHAPTLIQKRHLVTLFHGVEDDDRVHRFGQPNPLAPDALRREYGLVLAERGEFDTLVELARGPSGHAIRPEDDPESEGEIAGWARIYRAQGEWTKLRSLANRSAIALPEFVASVTAGEWPESIDKGFEWRLDAPPHSEHYRAACARLVESETLLAQVVGLEGLFSSHGGAEPILPAESVDRVLELATSGDPHVRELALHTLFQGLDRVPDRTGEILGAFAAEAERRLAADEFPEAYSSSPLARLISVGSFARMLPPAQITEYVPRGRQLFGDRVQRPMIWVDSLNFVLRRVGERGVDLYPRVFELASNDGRAPFHRWYVRRLLIDVLGPPDRPERRSRPADMAKIVAERLATITDREFTISLLEDVLPHVPVDAEGPARPFFERVLRDTRYETQMRAGAFRDLGGRFELLDWPGVVDGTDPLADRYCRTSEIWIWVSSRPEPERQAIWKVAVESSSFIVRMGCVGGMPVIEATLPHFSVALGDAAAAVRVRALESLAGAGRTDVASLVTPLLADSRPQVRAEAIKAVRILKPAGAVEALLPLLDDTKVDVRNLALEALQEIRRVLEERSEWQALLASLRAPVVEEAPRAAEPAPEKTPDAEKPEPENPEPEKKPEKEPEKQPEAEGKPEPKPDSETEKKPESARPDDQGDAPPEKTKDDAE